MAARGLGHLVFWSPAIFITICIIASITVDLYGQPPAEGLDVAQETWCLREALSLRDELRGQAGVALGPRVTVKARDAWRRFEPEHEARLEAAATRCRGTDELRAAFDQLREVYQGYRDLIRGNHEVMEGPQADLDRALQALGGPRAP